MNRTDLHQKIVSGEYDSLVIFPRWRTSRIEQERFAETDRQQRQAFLQDDHRLNTIFKADLRSYIETELRAKITDKQFNALYAAAKESSGGYSEILNAVDGLLTVVCEFVP